MCGKDWKKKKRYESPTFIVHDNVIVILTVIFLNRKKGTIITGKFQNYKKPVARIDIFKYNILLDCCEAILLWNLDISLKRVNISLSLSPSFLYYETKKSWKRLTSKLRGFNPSFCHKTIYRLAIWICKVGL